MDTNTKTHTDPNTECIEIYIFMWSDELDEPSAPLTQGQIQVLELKEGGGVMIREEKLTSLCSRKMTTYQFNTI